MDLDDPSSAPPLVAVTTTFGDIVTSEPITKVAPSGRGLTRLTLSRGWTENPDQLRLALAQIPAKSRLVDGFSRDSLSPQEGAPSALLQACAGARGVVRAAPPDRAWADAVRRQQQHYIREQGLKPYQPLGLRIVR